MERQDRGVTVRSRIDAIVALGRIAGVLVLLSAVGLAIWQAVDTGFSSDFYPDRMEWRLAWQTLVGVGWGGVAIILLAEIVDRLPRKE